MAIARTKTLAVAIVATLLAALGLFVGWRLHPHPTNLALPSPLVSAQSPEGMKRLKRAKALADFKQLEAAFEAQALVSYCGVASSVVALKALGMATTQGDFFASTSEPITNRLSVTFGGMSLDELGGYLAAHGAQTQAHHANSFDVIAFRAQASANLARPGDVMVVNYDRQALGQVGGGHISPVAAYDAGSDSLLILDTAAHKYPATWVPVPMLFDAMNTTDASSGQRRGYVDVFVEPPPL